MNLSTCTNTSSTIPLGSFIDLSASKRVTEVGFNSPRLRLWKTEYGSKLTLAPRSSKKWRVVKRTIPPFPMSSSRSKKEDKEKEILEVFKKVELNIPLIDVVKQIPKYTKFWKELSTTKRASKLKGHEMVSMGEVVSVVVQKEYAFEAKRPRCVYYPMCYW